MDEDDKKVCDLHWPALKLSAFNDTSHITFDTHHFMMGGTPCYSQCEYTQEDLSLWAVNYEEAGHLRN